MLRSAFFKLHTAISPLQNALIIRSHHPLKHFEVRIIPRRAIDRKFNGFKCVQIIRNHFFGSTRHHFRLILKCSASECAQNHHFVTVQYGNIQNPGQPLLMDFQEFPVTDFYRPVAVTLVEPVARPFPQVITSTSYQSFSSISFGLFVSVLNTVTSGV